MRLAIVSALVAGAAVVSFTAHALDDGFPTLRVTSHVDRTCEIWVNGALRATFGPFGDSGILSTAPRSSGWATDILARCEDLAFHKIVRRTYSHCDFSIDPTSSELTTDHCIGEVAP